jgi:hypothetical protein
MLTRLTHAGIVSVRTLPYTERERISLDLHREGAHFCRQERFVNQAEEV